MENKEMSWKFKYYDVNSGPDWDAIERNCDWFVDMKATPQDPIWHSEGDVQTHTKMVCEALISLPEFKELTEQEKHILFTASLMHDIEKRSTTKEEEKDGRVCIVSPKHALKGEFTSRTLLYKEFECPFDIREHICKIVRWHGKPLHEPTERQLVHLATEVRIDWVAMMSKADILGRTCQDAPEQFEKIEFFKMMAADLGCLTGPRKFVNDLAEYTYLNSENYIDYVPYDETNFIVTLMSGIPGSGKSSYIKKNLGTYPIVSLDAIREELGVKPTDKSGNGRVIQLAKERAKQHMRKHEGFVWDATNITKQMRSQVIDLFKSYGGLVVILYVEVPYKKLLAQNKDRESVVPEDVIERMISKLEPPVRSEAYHIINITY
jgi:predicted kinase